MALSRGALERRLGLQDPRGPAGIMSRGAPVFNGGTPQAQAGGGPQYGRPRSMPQGEEGGQIPPSLTTLLGSLPPQAAGPPPMAGLGGPPPMGGPPMGGTSAGGPPVGPPPGLMGSPTGPPMGTPAGGPPGLAGGPPGLAGGGPPGLQSAPGQLGTSPGLSQQGGVDPMALQAIMGILRNRFGAGGAPQGR